MRLGLDTHWLVIGAAVAGSLLLLLLAVGGIVHLKHKRLRREHREMIEENVFAAEKQRLQTIIQYLSLRQMQAGGGAAPRPSAVWAYEAQPQAPRCPHGSYLVPQDTLGGVGGFLNVCQRCAPQCVLGNDGILSPQIGQVAGVQNLPAVEGRIRPAQSPAEYPQGPPPRAPPGFVAVPMVLEPALA